MTGYASQLTPIAEWLSKERPTDHREVATKARLLLLDTLGCAIAGLGRAEVAGYADRLRGPGGRSYPGFPAGLSPQHLGHVMALAACWDEACEGLARAHGRPGLHAVPAAVALALADIRPLGATLDAVVAGYEIGGRLGEAWRIRPGMHVDGTWGTIAAAVAASILVAGRSAVTIEEAVQTAACVLPASLYAPVRQGATVRNLYAAQGVSRGIEIALALAAGVGAPTQALDAAVALTFDTERLGALAPPGAWLILEGYFKPFAAVRHVHYGVQAALDWRDRYGDTTETIDAIVLRTYAEANTYCGNRAPTHAIQAQFSLTYGVAHALVCGTLGPEAYDAAALANPQIGRLEASIAVDDGGEFPSGRGAVLEIVAEGTRTTVAVDGVAGDPDRPMPACAVVAKFGRYAGPRIGDTAAHELAARIMESPLDRSLADVIRSD